MADRRNQDIRDVLRRISTGYSDGLRAESRRRILFSTRQFVGAQEVGVLWPFAPRLAVAALLLVVLILPATQLRSRSGVSEAGSQVRDLEVTAQGDQVVLKWKDGDQPRRVVRATSREELAHRNQIQGELVRGERWVDTSSDEASLVYYFVE